MSDQRKHTDDSRMESMRVGVVIERRDSSHPWADNVWMPVAVVPGASPTDPHGPWKILQQYEDRVRYLAGTLDMEIWRTDTEAYIDSLSSNPPKVYVVLRQDDEGEHDYVPFLATVSTYEAQDYADAGEDIVEGVPMPEEILGWLKAFVEKHHTPEPFRKRRLRGKTETESAEKPKYGRGSGWSEGHEF